MIDDFVSGQSGSGPSRRKPKIISPTEDTNSPLRGPVFPAGFGVSEPIQAPQTPEPAFQPPEVIAARSQPIQLEQSIGAAALQETPEEPKSSSRFMHWQWRHSKKTTAIILTAGVLLIGGGAAAAYLTQPRDMGGTYTSQRPAAKPKPKPIYSTLTGLQIADESPNQRPVTGVMIENSPDSRPQSGIDHAGVVFEAIAEGGVTRFLTLYQDSQPDYIGPVRSVRPYYLQWCMGFDCSIAHVGGSPTALQNIKQWGVKDLDQFYNAGAYQRISSRYAPHNMYTSSALLAELETKKGFTSAYTGLARKDDPKTKPTPVATSIDFAISGVYYNAHFDYDATTNSYKRSQAGAPHMAVDKNGAQTQITPKVVVALVMQYGTEADGHSTYNVVGNGQAVVFQDGIATPASWSKTEASGQITLTDAAGKAIALNRGQTWFTALSAANKVTYK